MECNLFEETQRNKLSDSCALPRFFQQNLCWWPIFCAWASEPYTCHSSSEVNSVVRQLYSDYSGRRHRVLKCNLFCLFFCVFFFFFFSGGGGLPILHFGRWLVRGTFAVYSSQVRPVNRNKWRRTIWNAHMTYKGIRLMPIFLPRRVHQFSLVCLYFIGNFTTNNFWFRHAFVVSSV